MFCLLTTYSNNKGNAWLRTQVVFTELEKLKE